MGVATVEEFIQSLQHAEMPLSKRVAVECIHQLSQVGPIVASNSVLPSESPFCACMMNRGEVEGRVENWLVATCPSAVPSAVQACLRVTV